MQVSPKIVHVIGGYGSRHVPVRGAEMRFA